ncbi:MAG: dihydropteroate synthase [Phycisphaerales bacterium]|nr:MAG: dihydropteroate synthase [Phycisphaerales bacterium]
MPESPPTWSLAHGRSLVLDRPRIVAILNTTPDSFHEASRTGSVAETVDRAHRFAQEGADMLDIGGESTRPGAERVPPAEQVRRVVPVIRAIRESSGPASGLPISVDTTLAEVAREAILAGADAINDVASGSEDDAVFALAAEHGAGLILMHRLRPPDADSYSDRYTQPPAYTDVVAEVGAFLRQRALAALRAGVGPASIVIDPGLGFGKTVGQNFELIARTAELAAIGYPVMSAASRKSFVGAAASPGRETAPAERLAGSLAVSIEHARLGALLLRVHDPKEHAEAMRTVLAIGGAGPG